MSVRHVLILSSTNSCYGVSISLLLKLQLFLKMVICLYTFMSRPGRWLMNVYNELVFYELWVYKVGIIYKF